MDSELPLDWGSLVLNERATEDELDEDYMTVFCAENGPDDGPTEEDGE